jgi:glucose dehydrogenase
MQITNSTILEVTNTTLYAINVQTGALVVTITTDGTSASNTTITEPSSVTVPGGSVLTFALNSDIATITRL